MMSQVSEMLPVKDIGLLLVLACWALVPVSGQYAGSTAFVSQNGPVRLREALQNNTVATILLKEDYRMGNELDDIQPIPITRSGACLLLLVSPAISDTSAALIQELSRTRIFTNKGSPSFHQHWGHSKHAQQQEH
jgi:hypothetical protein